MRLTKQIKCISTFCAGMGLKDKCPIRIDLGLFEWLIWYPEDFPEWCSVPELRAAGYNIDADYNSMYTMDDLIACRNEDLNEFYLRNHDAVQRTLVNERELILALLIKPKQKSINTNAFTCSLREHADRRTRLHGGHLQPPSDRSLGGQNVRGHEQDYVTCSVRESGGGGTTAGHPGMASNDSGVLSADASSQCAFRLESDDRSLVEIGIATQHITNTNTSTLLHSLPLLIACLRRIYQNRHENSRSIFPTLILLCGSYRFHHFTQNFTLYVYLQPFYLTNILPQHFHSYTLSGSHLLYTFTTLCVFFLRKLCESFFLFYIIPK